jgi:hypothetical protein
MKSRIFGLGGIVVLVLAFVISRQAFFTVDEPEQVIITQFGEYKRTVQNPGLPGRYPSSRPSTASTAACSRVTPQGRIPHPATKNDS